MVVDVVVEVVEPFGPWAGLAAVVLVVEEEVGAVLGTAGLGLAGGAAAGETAGAAAGEPAGAAGGETAGPGRVVVGIGPGFSGRAAAALGAGAAAPWAALNSEPVLAACSLTAGGLAGVMRPRLGSPKVGMCNRPTRGSRAKPTITRPR